MSGDAVAECDADELVKFSGFGDIVDGGSNNEAEAGVSPNGVQDEGHGQGHSSGKGSISSITPAPASITSSSGKTTKSSRSRKGKGRKRGNSSSSPGIEDFLSPLIMNGHIRSTSPNGSATSSTTTNRTSRSRRSGRSISPDSESLFSVSSSKKKGGKNKNRTKQIKVKVMSPISDEITIHEDEPPTNDDEYIVEAIVGKKMIITDHGKKLHYHIKWKGWATPHNTWEPLENLEGCLELVDAYEEERTSRRNRGLDSDPEADEDPDPALSEPEHMERTRKELVECGVETRWPTEMIPLNLVGVVTIDKHLCYIVRHQVKKYVPSISAENTVIVRADGFRHMFPHIVITFYENCILWVNRAETKEELEFKALRALEMSKLVESAENSLSHKMKVDTSLEEEVELDEDGLPLPKISIKNNVDIFGLPESFTDSSSSSDDEFVERSIPNPFAVLAPRNQ